MKVLADVEIVAIAAAGSLGPIRLSAQASAASDVASMAAPITSNGRFSPRSSGANPSRSTTAMSASGGLIQNTSGQPKFSVSQPPKIGPPAVVNADAAAHTPIAWLRSSRGYTAPTSARLAGVTIAAAIPCAMRATMRSATDGANAHAADANPNATHPTASIRARP